MQKSLQISVGEYSTKGKKELNQDFHDLNIPKEPYLSSKGIAIAIADGISSSKVSGEASKVSVVNFLQDYQSTSAAWSVKKSGLRVISAINSWLYSQNRKDRYHLEKDSGYVCTFSAVVLKSNTAHIFHVGDSRVYLLRDKELKLLTTDHRVWIDKEKSYLSRALGIDSKLSIDYDSIKVEVGDILLLMTDGVYEYIQKEYLDEKFEKNSNLQECAKDITKFALDSGSKDNLSIQIIKIDSLPDKDSNEIQREIESKPLAPILEPRESFDGFKIIREISASSRSHVYLATDEQTHERVVIKTPSIELKDDKAYLERFLLEEWIARRLNNAHILKAYELKREQNFIYTVSEYIEGQTLTQWKIDNPNPKLDEIRDIIEQIGKGLIAFHRLEMVHQDLRPENILIDKSGTVKIIDFGSTKVAGILEIDSFLEQYNLLGTAIYSAPEYFIGEKGSSKSDIFSLGVLTYWMLSSEFPYGVDVAKATNKSAQNRLKYKSLYPKQPIWIDETLKKSLAINPDKRYSVVSEFLHDLKKPNKKFLNRKRAPIIERNPVLFWQILTLLFAFSTIFLLVKDS